MAAEVTARADAVARELTTPELPQEVRRELSVRTDIKVGGTAIVDAAGQRWYFRRTGLRDDAWKFLSSAQHGPNPDRADDLTPEQRAKRRAEAEKMGELLDKAAKRMAASAKPATGHVYDWNALEPGILEEAVAATNAERVADMLQRAARAAVNPNENEEFVYGPDASIGGHVVDMKVAREVARRHTAEATRHIAEQREGLIADILRRGGKPVIHEIGRDKYYLFDKRGLVKPIQWP